MVWSDAWLRLPKHFERGHDGQSARDLPGVMASQAVGEQGDGTSFLFLPLALGFPKKDEVFVVRTKPGVGDLSVSEFHAM